MGDKKTVADLLEDEIKDASILRRLCQHALRNMAKALWYRVGQSYRVPGLNPTDQLHDVGVPKGMNAREQLV